MGSLEKALPGQDDPHLGLTIVEASEGVALVLAASHRIGRFRPHEAIASCVVGLDLSATALFEECVGAPYAAEVAASYLAGDIMVEYPSLSFPAVAPWSAVYFGAWETSPMGRTPQITALREMVLPMLGALEHWTRLLQARRFVEDPPFGDADDGDY